jgi:hypothetical protein
MNYHDYLCKTYGFGNVTPGATVPPLPPVEPLSACGHQLVSEAEVIEAAVECWARGQGSFQEFFERMSKRGYMMIAVPK